MQKSRRPPLGALGELDEFFPINTGIPCTTLTAYRGDGTLSGHPPSVDQSFLIDCSAVRRTLRPANTGAFRAGDIYR